MSNRPRQKQRQASNTSARIVFCHDKSVNRNYPVSGILFTASFQRIFVLLLIDKYILRLLTN